MIIPNGIIILGEKWKIKFCKKALGNPNYDGICLREQREIVINPDLDLLEQYKTLWHEIGHALLSRSGVIYSGGLSAELEEIIVENYANLIHDIFFNGVLKFKK